MENLGQAEVIVGISDSLAGIQEKVQNFNFDVSAWNINTLKKSQSFPPLLIEKMSDESDEFAALYPSKRKFYIDNFLEGTKSLENRTSSDSTFPYITFKPVGADEKSPLLNLLLKNGDFNEYELLQPDEYTGENFSEYKGPRWSQAQVSRIVEPDDDAAVKAWYKKVGLEGGDNNTRQEGDQKTLDYMNQQIVRDGLYWGIESSPFLTDNMPFWINIKMARTPPTAKNATFFIISLGLDNTRQSYDIYFSLNSPTKVIDYYDGRETDDGSSPPAWNREFDNDLSKMLDYNEEIEIGVMTVAGRLVVWSNQVNMIYSRINRSASGDNAGSFEDCHIASGGIRIYGSNVQARINVCPMVFAPLAAISVPITSIPPDPGTSADIPYKGVQNDNTFSGPVCILPQQPDRPGDIYGVDCYKFNGPNGKSYPVGVGLHMDGEIYFSKAESVGITSLPNADIYVIAMKPSNSVMTTADGETLTIKRGGAPYFIRLKGGYRKESVPSGSGYVVIKDVISATQEITAPDYFHALSTASVTLYNEGGKYDSLKGKQSGIKISWGWNGNRKTTFTGIVTSAQSSETAGMETLTLECQDYMHVLKSTPIINSPFYDGMIGYYAIMELAQRAGVSNFIKDWESEEDYFLPSGFSFTQPLMKFKSTQTLFECMNNIVQRFEAFLYFDSNGYLHISKLPGGLFSETGGNFSASFTSNPTADPATVILDEKQITFDFNSTVSKINIMSIDMDTRATIIVNHTADEGNQNHLLFQKIMLLDQPALGKLETTEMYARRLGQRVFYPIRKSGFKTSGSTNDTILDILSFIKVDGMEFRVTSMKRDYSADANDFVTEYGVEWLGGK